MKKLTLLTTAVIIAACGSANAQQNDPSLGNRLMQSWNDNTTRQMWNDPVKSEPAFPTAGSASVPSDERMEHGRKHGKHHHGKKAAAHVAAKISTDDKAKMKAERKAKWDAMTPEQKAAWKAKHSKKAAAAAK